MTAEQFEELKDGSLIKFNAPTEYDSHIPSNILMEHGKVYKVAKNRGDGLQIYYQPCWYGGTYTKPSLRWIDKKYEAQKFIVFRMNKYSLQKYL
jgi:hypothetical protein